MVKSYYTGTRVSLGRQVVLLNLKSRIDFYHICLSSALYEWVLIHTTTEVLLQGTKKRKKRIVLTKRDRRKAGEDMETVSCKENYVYQSCDSKCKSQEEIMSRKIQHTVYSAQGKIEMIHILVYWCVAILNVYFSLLGCTAIALIIQLDIQIDEEHASIFSSLTTYNIHSRHIFL